VLAKEKCSKTFKAFLSFIYKKIYHFSVKYRFAKIVQIFHAQQVGSGLGSESGSAALDGDPDPAK
jgi:hypothetical protein